MSTYSVVDTLIWTRRACPHYGLIYPIFITGEGCGTHAVMARFRLLMKYLALSHCAMALELDSPHPCIKLAALIKRFPVVKLVVYLSICSSRVAAT